MEAEVNRGHGGCDGQVDPGPVRGLLLQPLDVNTEQPLASCLAVLSMRSGQLSLRPWGVSEAGAGEETSELTISIPSLTQSTANP